MKTKEEILEIRKLNLKLEFEAFEKDNEILLNEIESELIKDGDYVLNEDFKNNLCIIRKYSDNDFENFLDNLLKYFYTKNINNQDISDNITNDLLIWITV